jgi:hypothetical protein
MDNKVNKNMFLLIKTYLIGPYWTIRNNYMVASSATISSNILNILLRLKNDFEAIFALHASYSPLAHFLVSFGNDVMAARRQGQSLSTSRELRSLPSRERMG